jgi:5-oxoprolinase (ATP-hydrolysing) subunit A
MQIDLNSDVGEGFGVYTIGSDDQIMSCITSANIACGFHAADPETIWKTIKMAKANGVAVGAHPSYPDLVGFGRRPMEASAAEVKADVIYQVGALAAFCKAEGVKLQHVKPHGALYNKAAVNSAIAVAIAEAIKAVDEDLYFMCLSNSEMVTAAKAVGIKYVEEVFADRAYTSDGKLVARTQPGAVIHDSAEIAERVLKMVKDRAVVAIDGTVVPLNAQTICVHGDNAEAIEMVRAIKNKLEQEKVQLKPFSTIAA